MNRMAWDRDNCSTWQTQNWVPISHGPNNSNCLLDLERHPSIETWANRSGIARTTFH
ncbi:hypothetical protein AESSP_02708 [Aestuariimicrobium sp. T2.26MG-19.2B]|nr:hypothetical protein AESSP_02708 [Aestuariimicrobium sp. T2.26MG-19.2B]